MPETRNRNTVLIVDDDPKILAVLSKVLEKAGHRVVTAVNAESFFAALDVQLPDLIILDVLLPGTGIDGFEIAARLKADQLTREVPLIFLTICTDTEYQMKGFQLGAVDYIIKPLELDVAIARITTHLTIYNLRKNLETKNRLLQQEIEERSKAEEKVKAALKEKEILLKEVHHRVKNNLQLVVSLLNLQARRIESEEGKTVLSEIKNRVSSIALVHEKLYQSTSLAHIDFGEYIRTLTTQLFQSTAGASSGNRLQIDADKFFLDIDKAIPCALVINELVTNALKYAFPRDQAGHIAVSFKVAEIEKEEEKGAEEQSKAQAKGKEQKYPPQKITLAVADDGTGLPGDLDIKSPSTLGMQIVHALVNQLRGTLTVSQPGGKGTRFSIDFYVNSEH